MTKVLSENRRPRWWSTSGPTGPNVLLQPEKHERAPDTRLKQVLCKDKSACQLVLDHFDQQYHQELGDLWKSARTVLLDPRSWQYGVLLNRFAAVTDIQEVLQSRGFSTLLPEVDSSMLDDVLGSTHPSADRSACPSEDPRLRCVSDSPVTLALPQCYIHPHPLRLPSQAHRPGQLKQYYLLNAASLLPVLALQVKDGEKVLDLCAAPGGKALAIMQCATPDLLCCNEPNPQRHKRLVKTLESFLPHSLNSRVIVSAHDGRSFGQSEAGMYDKVLVDAPCSNDRSWLYSADGQQVQQRLKERARLPRLQAQLLRSALSAVRPGGAVVYSTCTLSSSENYAVVEAVLKDCPEAEADSLWEEMALPFMNYFTFSPAPPHATSLQPQCGAVSSSHHRLGILVIPQPWRTWGPMFLSRIRRKTASVR